MGDGIRERHQGPALPLPWVADRPRLCDRGVGGKEGGGAGSSCGPTRQRNGDLPSAMHEGSSTPASPPPASHAAPRVSPATQVWAAAQATAASSCRPAVALLRTRLRLCLPPTAPTPPTAPHSHQVPAGEHLSALLLLQPVLLLLLGEASAKAQGLGAREEAEPWCLWLSSSSRQAGRQAVALHACCCRNAACHACMSPAWSVGVAVGVAAKYCSRCPYKGMAWTVCSRRKRGRTSAYPSPESPCWPACLAAQPLRSHRLAHPIAGRHGRLGRCAAVMAPLVMQTYIHMRGWHHLRRDHALDSSAHSVHCARWQSAFRHLTVLPCPKLAMAQTGRHAWHVALGRWVHQPLFGAIGAMLWACWQCNCPLHMPQAGYTALPRSMSVCACVWMPWGQTACSGKACHDACACK